jgi:hypothetical protein
LKEKEKEHFYHILLINLPSNSFGLLSKTMEINILVSKLDEIKICKKIKEIESSKNKSLFTSIISNSSLIHTKK